MSWLLFTDFPFVNVVVPGSCSATGKTLCTIKAHPGPTHPNFRCVYWSPDCGTGEPSTPLARTVEHFPVAAQRKPVTWGHRTGPGISAAGLGSGPVTTPGGPYREPKTHRERPRGCRSPSETAVSDHGFQRCRRSGQGGQSADRPGGGPGNPCGAGHGHRAGEAHGPPACGSARTPSSGRPRRPRTVHAGSTAGRALGCCR